MKSLVLFSFSFDTTTIIILCVAAAFVVLCAVLLYFTVFSHARIKRQARELCGKFEREHALLFGQDSQYIKRLETISSMNLVYVQQYMDWNKRFKDVRDVSDASAQAVVNQLKDLLNERKYKDIKGYLSTARRVIDDYENQVDSLSENLKNKFRDEEECRALALEEKESYRKVKQDYYAHQNDMSLVVGTFDVLFGKLDSFFDEAEQDIENARYTDAKSIFNDRVAPVVNQIRIVLKDLPNICILISSVIPDKLASLSNHYDEMIQGGYPLHHIILKGDMENMNIQLSHLSEKVKALSFGGVLQALDEMQKEIDGYLEAFEKEKEARIVFDNECKGIYEVENNLENQFINLCHAFPKVRSIYLLGADDQAKIDAIQNTINKAGASKRSLDTYVHSATKQPYSILVEKMHTLRDQDNEAGKAMGDFQNYLISLKNDSEAANASLSVYYNHLKQAERTIREINVDNVSNKFVPLIDSVYSAVDMLSSDLSNAPIDVGKVNQDLSALHSLADSTFKDIENTVNDMSAAESEIVFANRHRRVSAEINTGLLQAENLFYAGNFKQAYDVANAVNKNAKDTD